MADNNNGNNNNDEDAAACTVARLATAVRDLMNDNEQGDDPHNNERLQQIEQNLTEAENHLHIPIKDDAIKAAAVTAVRLATAFREMGDDPRNNERRRRQLQQEVIEFERQFTIEIEIKAQRARDKFISLIRQTDEFPLRTKDKINELIGDLPSRYRRW